MKTYARIAVGVFLGTLVATLSITHTRAQAPASVAIDPDDIGGSVTSPKGPEAGVWVIAETTNLPTKFARIVVTDDRGRYVIPDLPSANYQVFVRGYGLVDSKRVAAKPGQQLNLNVDVAPTAKAAAEVYPAAWWLSMVQLPEGAEAQKKFALDLKECHDCHQIGNKQTRQLAAAFTTGSASSLDAWEKRTHAGPSGPSMAGFFIRLNEDRKAFADWTDRVARGELPKSAPSRPAGVERNLVVSLWDWGLEKDGRSDMAASDTRNPRVNAGGPVYGASQMTDTLSILDPSANKAEVIKIPTNAPMLVSGFNAAPNPSPAWGGQADIWKRAADPRSIAILADGKVLVAARQRANQQQPAFCGSASNNKFGKYYRLQQSARQVMIFDPKTKQFENIDTCFSADHNQVSKDNFVYFGQNGAIGWIDLTAWQKTHDAEASQGWCPAVLDTNGDGKITSDWTEPEQPINPTKDHRIQFGCYSVTINPKDGSLWCSGIGRGDRKLMRLEKGSNPPMTCRAEVFEPPSDETFGSGGVESTADGLVWQDWRVSGEFSSFDRSKCKTTKDPNATGQSCPEGWKFYNNGKDREPTYVNSRYKALESYLTHIDAHDTLGLGEVPLYGSTDTDSFEVLLPQTREFITLRVPYPLGFFARSANGRVDDPSKGWKGKGLWSDFGSYADWHIEGGPGTLPKVVKFQMRPNPLAK
jgi:hypothetical protein